MLFYRHKFMMMLVYHVICSCSIEVIDIVQYLMCTIIISVYYKVIGLLLYIIHTCAGCFGLEC